LYPQEVSPELFAFHREFLKTTPDELDTTIGLLKSPEGVPLVGVIAVYAGEPSEGERVLAPLRKFRTPIADLIHSTSYLEAQSLADAMVPIGNRYYWKSSFAGDLSDLLGAVLAEGARQMPSPRSMILCFEMKGEIQRVPRSAMAFDQRDANFEVSIIANWTEPSEDAANIGWARTLWQSAQPFVSPAGYVNHMTADEPEDRVLAAYGAEKYRRLAQIKHVYDPDNFFCLNHNIKPTSA
jgi:hypothetical protein